MANTLDLNMMLKYFLLLSQQRQLMVRIIVMYVMHHFMAESKISKKKELIANSVEMSVAKLALLKKFLLRILD